ncbi:MAG: hypothetical protein D6798_11685 [Deltaproteobacteria bacterium]|nr:MAG: hypothetical protein D6798_11685 [Deltaproteobacteria bacterium]
MIRHVLPFLLSTILLALSPVARALDVPIWFQYAVDFTDASTSSGDDYLTDLSPVAAAGVLLRVTRLSDGVLLYDDFVADSGTDVGCATVTGMSAFEDYRLAVVSKASVNGNIVSVLNNDTDNAKYACVVPSFRPSSVPGLTVTLTTNIADQWRTMAAATWAMRRSNAGLSGENLRFYTQRYVNPDGSMCGSCVRLVDSGPPLILAAYMCPSAECLNTFTKTLIVHEMGHMVARYANAGQKAHANYGYVPPPGGCIGEAGDSHALNSEEYQGAAAAEGIAHFWAAYAFNDESELDCAFDWYGDWIDWENNGHTTGSVWDADLVSCAIYPNLALLTHGIGSGDYAADMCTAGAGRAVEYDWLRMLWDLVSAEGIPVEDVYDIWDAADPQGWASDGTDAAAAMSAGAATVGWQPETDTEAAFNGTDR